MELGDNKETPRKTKISDPVVNLSARSFDTTVALRMLRDGATQPEVAKALGIHRSTLHRFIAARRADIKEIELFRTKRADELSEMQLDAAGWSKRSCGMMTF